MDERYLELLRELNVRESRDEKNQVLVTRIGDLQQRVKDNVTLDDFQKKLVEFFESEWDHQYLVCTALRRIGNKRRHDWSKDYVYVFALAGKFCFRVEAPEFGEKWIEEVNRHYALEPHHCQHTQTGGTINRLDVEEMAIDQLARELYRNKGVINQANMTKYLPKFDGKNAEEKLEWFKEYITQHTALMIDVYNSYASEENTAK